MNNLSFYVFVGFMVMFLAYQYISSAMMDQQQNAKGVRDINDHNRENNDNDNGPGGDGVY